MLATMVALTAGCGLSTTDEPERIGTDSAVDEPSSAPASASATGATPEGAGSQAVTVWLVDTLDDGTQALIPVERRVTDSESHEARLLALIRQGPTDAEHDEDIVSFVPEDSRLIDVEARGQGVLAVELSDNFYDQRGDTARYAFAQVVFTMTDMDDVDRVLFEAETAGSLPVDGDGQTRNEPLGRDAYDSLPVVSDADG